MKVEANFKNYFCKQIQPHEVTDICDDENHGLGETI